MRDILAYLRLIYDEDDDTAFERIFNVPDRGLEKQTFHTISKTANNSQCSLLKASKLVRTLQPVSASLGFIFEANCSLGT